MAKILFTFDVELNSEPWTYEKFSLEDISEIEVISEFESQFFGGWDFILHAEPWSRKVPDTDSFIGLDVRDFGRVPFDSSGFELRSLEKLSEGKWEVTVVSKVCLKLTIQDSIRIRGI